MFRHQGKTRTEAHNLRIATILSFVAGIVNVTGFLAFKQFTTNVTGHFALVIYDVARLELWQGTIFLFYILSFLFGSFSSSLLIEKFKENKKLNIYVFPTIIEGLILTSIVVFSHFSNISNPNMIVCSLLFAMGLQNSFVTKISNAVIRTTHLTGLFTDLGIELSHLFFPHAHPNRHKLIETIKLRIYIITFFFLGGLVAGYCYLSLNLQLNTLIIAMVILFLNLIYDDVRFRFIQTNRKYQQKRSNNTTTKNSDTSQPNC
jgi:uncharacterized membrane protein YoaK (UPF0700 family)